MASDNGVVDILKPMSDKVHILKLNIELLKCIKYNKPESLKIIKEIDAKRWDVVESVEKLDHLFKEQKRLTAKMKVLQVELAHGIHKLDRLEDLLKTKQVTENNGCSFNNDSTSTQHNESVSYTEGNLQMSSYHELSPVEVNISYPPSYKSSHLKPKFRLRFDINYLNVEDFKMIPKYMLGRLSLEEINKFVDVVNEARSKKYSILSKLVSSLKTKEVALYRIFKKQNSILKGRDFITEEDIAREFGKRVLDKKSSNFLTILRHTKKLGRETFDGGVAYIVTNS